MSDLMTHMTVSEYLHYRKQAKGKDKPKEKGEGFAEILEKEKKGTIPTDQSVMIPNNTIDNSICMHFTTKVRKEQ